MFAGDRPTQFETETEDLGGQVFGPFERAVFFAVEKNERVQIAIARMKDVGDPDAGLCAHASDLLQSGTQLGAGHDAVLNQVVGR